MGKSNKQLWLEANAAAMTAAVSSEVLTVEVTVSSANSRNKSIASVSTFNRTSAATFVAQILNLPCADGKRISFSMEDKTVAEQPVARQESAEVQKPTEPKKPKFVNLEDPFDTGTPVHCVEAWSNLLDSYTEQLTNIFTGIYRGHSYANYGIYGISTLLNAKVLNCRKLIGKRSATRRIFLEEGLGEVFDAAFDKLYKLNEYYAKKLSPTVRQLGADSSDEDVKRAIDELAPLFNTLGYYE